MVKAYNRITWTNYSRFDQKQFQSFKTYSFITILYEFKTILERI